MLVFTGMDPSFQQTNIHGFTDPPAMKLFGPPNLKSILLQQLYFREESINELFLTSSRYTQPVTHVPPRRQDTIRNTNITALICTKFADRHCMQFTGDPSDVDIRPFVQVPSASDDEAYEAA